MLLESGKRTSLPLGFDIVSQVLFADSFHSDARNSCLGIWRPKWSCQILWHIAGKGPRMWRRRRDWSIICTINNHIQIPYSNNHLFVQSLWSKYFLCRFLIFADNQELWLFCSAEAGHLLNLKTSSSTWKHVSTPLKTNLILSGW